tara:strand:+ start:153 stop:311 length:159 start_codon:yes stop_codon:yes gene_type:complete
MLIINNKPEPFIKLDMSLMIFPQIIKIIIQMLYFYHTVISLINQEFFDILEK